MVEYEKLIDSNEGVSAYQFIIFLWMALSNIVHAAPLGYMVFVGMKPASFKFQNETNATETYLFGSIVQEWNLVGEKGWIVPLLTSI